MELTQIRYFLELAKNCHVTQTAQRLHIAQPALTQSVRRLERELDVKIFENVGRNIRLTPCGEYLNKKFDKIIKELDTVPKELACIKGELSRTVKISAQAASYSVAKMLTEYKKANPEIIFKMTQAENFADADIVITTETFGCESIKIGRSTSVEEEIFLAVPIDSKFSKKDTVTLEEVREEEFICLMGSKHLRYICDNFCRQSGFVPKVIFESDNLAAIKNMVSANIGIGFWPEFSWGRFDSEHVKLLGISSPHCKRNIVISEKEGSAVAVKKFYDYICEGFKGMAK